MNINEGRSIFDNILLSLLSEKIKRGKIRMRKLDRKIVVSFLVH